MPKPRLDQTLDRANSDVVLIVDDVPDNLAVLHDALDESGYTVLVATHGQAALERAAQVLPDIVLLDAIDAANPACALWTADLRGLARQFQFEAIGQKLTPGHPTEREPHAPTRA